MALLRFICTLVVVLLDHSDGCLTPEQTSVLSLADTDTQLSVYQGMLNYANTTLDAPLGIFNYTAPKQMRTWLGVMSSSYTVMAWHQKSSLDFFSRESESDDYRRCNPNTDAEKRLIERHAREAFAYTYLWSIQEFVPEWTQLTIDYAATLGLDLARCSTENEFTCGLDTPYGLARFINKQTKIYMKYDGWNAGAFMSKEQYSWQYQEYRKSNQYETPAQKCTNSWKVASQQCALFDLGYFEDVCWTPQQFQFHGVIYDEKYLMQHVAQSGRSYFLGDENICASTTPYPCYDLAKEANNVISRTNSNGDDEKAEIEFFDNVFGWYSTVNNEYWKSSPLTQFEIITGLTAAIAAMYEATLVVWRNKLQYGVIRPRTYININKPSTMKGWKPYMMDNATPEFPSHISCMCSAYTRAMRKTANQIGEINPELSITLWAGSSNIEANEPTNNVLLTFESWGEMLGKCNGSRLNSGNHFSKSTSEAEQLCGPIGPSVVEAFQNMVAGKQPSYKIDKKLPIYVKRCPFKPLLGNREEWVDESGDKETAIEEDLRTASEKNGGRAKNKRVRCGAEGIC